MPAIKLLCTDFDGTLVEFSGVRCTEEFAEILLYQKRNHGAWAINTGRSFLHILEGLAYFQAPILPDYVITLEREIYHLSPTGEWQDFGDWNLLCRARHQEMLTRRQDALRTICQELTHREEITLIEDQGILSGLVTSTEEVMEHVASELDWACRDFTDWAYQRNTIYLRFCHVDYHKGSALGELSRLTGVSRQTILAAGDNFNDISMLNGTCAAMCACPANAVDPVKQAVLNADGFVASKNYALGVAEAVQYFLGV
jgi:HAD superfamily hydrolase (TIGR01484 family)